MRLINGKKVLTIDVLVGAKTILFFFYLQAISEQATVAHFSFIGFYALKIQFFDRNIQACFRLL